MSNVTGLILALVLLFGFGSDFSDPSLGEAPQPDGLQQKLSLVQKIYVGDMGWAGESERFRHLLEDQLTENGFTVVEDEAQADAILTGALSVRVLDDESEARVYVTLRTQGGERLWARDFGNGFFHSLLSRKEPVMLRAEDVAKGLKKAVRK